jgi:hypothetical protein
MFITTSIGMIASLWALIDIANNKIEFEAFCYLFLAFAMIGGVVLIYHEDIDRKLSKKY